jgi:hypothetical protein
VSANTFVVTKATGPVNREMLLSYRTVGLQVVQAPLATLPWYHQIALLEKLNDPDSRLWYAAAAVENACSGKAINLLLLRLHPRLERHRGELRKHVIGTLGASPHRELPPYSWCRIPPLPAPCCPSCELKGPYFCMIRFGAGTGVISINRFA